MRRSRPKPISEQSQRSLNDWPTLSEPSASRTRGGVKLPLLGLLLRQLSGVGTPRSLQGRTGAAFAAVIATLSRLWTRVWPAGPLETPDPPTSFAIDLMTGCHEHLSLDLRSGASTTGC